MSSEAPSGSQRSPRVEAIDAGRGLALVGMFAFHLAWDLAYFGFIAPEFPFRPGFMFFGHCVATTFLALAGASLVLASRGGMNWRKYWLRLAMIVAAALAVTAATWWLFPDSFIFFGILHCIAAASLVAPLFLRAPAFVALAAAAAIVAAPFLWTSPVFDAPWLLWTGLGETEPRSNDLRAFFPWAGFLLAGLGLTLAAPATALTARIAAWRAGNRLTRAATWGGRHSLLVYLIHQPLLYGLVWLVATATPPEEANYMRACVPPCLSAGGDAGYCSSACACVVKQTKTENLWRKVLRNSLSPVESSRFEEIGRTCAREAAP